MAHYEVLVRSAFSAAHRLRLHDGNFEPLHGHNWRVEVRLIGERLDEIGILADFTDLKPALDEVATGLHNTCLNDLPQFAADNPSTEHVAKYIHDRLAPQLRGAARISLVRVWETDDCAACYVP